MHYFFRRADMFLSITSLILQTSPQLHPCVKIQNLTATPRMFQSFSRNNPLHRLQLRCHKCKQKPNQQFVLLLCDHVICGACLDQYVEMRGTQYEGIRCPCGMVSYFRAEEEGGQWVATREQIDRKSKKNISVNIHNTSIHHQDRPSKRESSRPSVGLIQSKNTTSTKNLSRINTEFQGFSESGRYETNEPQAQIVDKYLLQQSKYPVQSIRSKPVYTQNMKERPSNFGTITPPVTDKKVRKDYTDNNNLHYEPQYIDSESVTEENQYQNIRSDHQEDQQSPQFNHGGQTRPNSQQKRIKQSQLTSQFKSELKFLQLTHKKNLETLERVYRQAKEKLNADYARLQDNLKDLCLENLVLDRDQSRVNIGKIINMRYQTYVGSNLQKLTEDIKKYSFERQDSFVSNIMARSQRFSSPQAYRIQNLETEPASLYTTKPLRTYAQNKQNCNNLNHHQHQNYNKLTQYESKLQKRTKRKTNIIIEL